MSEEKRFTVSDFEKGNIVIKFNGNLIHLTNVLNFVGIDWVDYFELLSDTKKLVGKFLYVIPNFHNKLELRIADNVANERVIVVKETDIFVLDINEVVKTNFINKTNNLWEKMYGEKCRVAREESENPKNINEMTSEELRGLVMNRHSNQALGINNDEKGKLLTFCGGTPQSNSEIVPNRAHYGTTVCDLIEDNLRMCCHKIEKADIYLSKKLYKELCKAFGAKVKKYKGYKIIVK
jgi:hypothetical protein